MRLLLSTLFMVISLPLFSQTSDSMFVSTDFIIQSAERMQAYQLKDSISTKKIETLNLMVLNLQKVNNQNESILKLKDTELEMYRSLANRFIELPPRETGKWHESKTFNFVAGIVVGGIVIYSGAYIVSTIR